MATSYRPYEPDQVMLLPAAPQDWLPPGHLAHFINDTVEALNLKVFYARYEGGGSRKQHAQLDAQRYPHTAAMAAKLRTDEGKAAYRKRKWIAEPPNGWIKSVLGFRQFSLRGLKRVQAEFKLVCMALNLRRMGSMRAA